MNEEVTYVNKVDGITLAGTLTVPNITGTFPAVLLISGMGPNDRDYTMLGHKPFLVIADYLTKQGIAVLRIDKRGVGKSTGTFGAFVTSQDLVRDVQAGIDYLKSRKEIDPNRIGLLGHSEGGMIAPMVASQTKNVSFVILMAGVMTTAIEHVLTQVALQLEADGATKELIDYDRQIREKLLFAVKEEPDADKAAETIRNMLVRYFTAAPEAIKTEAERLLFAIKESNTENVISFFNSPTYRYWLGHNPVKDLRTLLMPLLAMNGNLDFITVSHIHLPIIKKALQQAGNKDITIIEMPKMNHWFQSCVTGAMSEYGNLQETISPVVLKQIGDWIIERFVANK